MTTTIEDIVRAIERLSDAGHLVTNAYAEVAQARLDLDDIEARIGLDERIDGKNAELREAQRVRLQMQSEQWRDAHERHEAATQQLGFMRVEQEVAREDLKRLHAQAQFEIEQMRAMQPVRWSEVSTS